MLPLRRTLADATLRDILDGLISSRALRSQQNAIQTVNAIVQQLPLADQLSYLKKALELAEESKSHVSGKDKKDLQMNLNFNSQLHSQNQKEAAKLRNNITIRNRNTSVLNYNSARVLCQLSKAQLDKVCVEAYEYLALNPPHFASATDTQQWWELVQETCHREIGQTKKFTNMLDCRVVSLPQRPANKIQLGEYLSRDLRDYLFIKGKAGGANSPGKFGGEFITCYQIRCEHGEPEIGVQKVLWKQDTHRTKIKHANNIAEFVTSNLLNEIVGDAAATVFLARSPWDSQGNEYKATQRTGDEVYDVSIFVDGLDDLYRELYRRSKISHIKAFYAEIERIKDLTLSSTHGAARKIGGLLESINISYEEGIHHYSSTQIEKLFDTVGVLKAQLKKMTFTAPEDKAVKKIVKEVWHKLKPLYNVITEELPRDRPKALNTPFEKEFTEVFNKNIVDPNNPDLCAYDGYAPTTVGSLLCADFDAHTGNYFVRRGEGLTEQKDVLTGQLKKCLVRIDFGGALHSLKDEVNIHSQLEHPFGFGPTNHIAEWPRGIRVCIPFAEELERQGRFDRERLARRIERIMRTVADFHDIPALTAFAQHLQSRQHENIIDRAKRAVNYNASDHDPAIRDHQYKRQLTYEITRYLTARIFARQVSMLNLALEIRMSVLAKSESGTQKIKKNPELEQLIQAHPNYFLQGDFHFRHSDQINRKDFFEAAMRKYVAEILEKRWVLLNLSNMKMRAKAFAAQLRIVAMFEMDSDEKAKLQSQLSRLLAAMQNGINNSHLIYECDQAYRDVSAAYHRCVDPVQKKGLRYAMCLDDRVELTTDESQANYVAKLEEMSALNKTRLIQLSAPAEAETDPDSSVAKRTAATEHYRTILNQVVESATKTVTALAATEASFAMIVTNLKKILEDTQRRALTPSVGPTSAAAAGMFSASSAATAEHKPVSAASLLPSMSADDEKRSSPPSSPVAPASLNPSATT